MGNPYSYRESDVSLHDAQIREAHNHRHFTWAEGDATGYARAKAESDKAKAEQAEIVKGLVEALESIPAHTLDHDADGKETMVFRYTAYAIWDTEKRLPAIAKAKGE